MTIEFNVNEKFALFTEHWTPKVAARLNGQEVKLVKVEGEFPWHHHDHVDELFLVWRGSIRMEFRDRTVEMGEGDVIVVPRGIEHRPVAENEAQLVIFEPAGVRNTGNIEDSAFTAPMGATV